MPLMAAMTILHSLVPPQLLGADVRRTIVYGIMLTIPLMIISGIVYGGWVAKRISPPLPAIADLAVAGDEHGSALGVLTVIVLLILPVVLPKDSTFSQPNYQSPIARSCFGLQWLILNGNVATPSAMEL